MDETTVKFPTWVYRLRNRWCQWRYRLTLKRAKRFLGKRPIRWPNGGDDLLLLGMLEWYEPPRMLGSGEPDLGEPHLLSELERFRDRVYGDRFSSGGYTWLDNVQERAEELVRDGLLIGHEFNDGPKAHATYSLSHEGRTRLYELRASASRDRSLKIAVTALLVALLVDAVALYVVACE